MKGTRNGTAEARNFWIVDQDYAAGAADATRGRAEKLGLSRAVILDILKFKPL